jgi:hypothetical protein
MSCALGSPLDRIRFRDGQLLASRDMRDEHSVELCLRAMHVCLVHDVWGIGLGLRVDLLTDRTGVDLHPGYAIDACGRDVIVPHRRLLRVPVSATPQAFMLVAGHCPETVGWVTPAEFRPGEHVPLASAQAMGGVISGMLNRQVRRFARALTRPRIASGATEAGHTGWYEGAQALGWIGATVDTSSAGFVHSPQYLAVVSSNAVGFIYEARPSFFRYAILTGSPPFGFATSASAAEGAGWSIAWIGIESEARQ